MKKNFDYYYTGGFISYISTNNELKRYHGDIDIYFNEEELPLLKEVVDNSKNFTFKSNIMIKRRGNTVGQTVHLS